MGFKFLILTVVICFNFIPNVFAFDPALTFEKKCSSCHTIGGGNDVGPDLKGVTKRRDLLWINKFIKGSQSMILGGDPVANELFVKFKNKKMPDQELSDDEITQILAFIENSSGTGAVAKIKSALDAKPEEVFRGKQIFEGRFPLTNKGPACFTCHAAGDAGTLGGGALAPDLSHAYALYEDKGLSKVLTNITFPTMSNPFKDKPLTADEVYWIKAYLYTVDKEAHDSEQEDNQKKFIFLGIFGTIAGFGVLDLIWKNRRKKTRRPL